MFEAPDGSAAKGKTDLLTVVKHEIGHALGWDGDSALFRAQMDGLFGGDDLDNQITSTIGLHTLEGDGQGGSANESPSNNINELSHLSRVVYPNDLMQPTIGVSTRRLQSPIDISRTALQMLKSAAPSRR